jgi:hypothetical protein
MQMDSFANEEEPKVAFTRIRKRAVQHCLCQLPSMTITLGILSLSFGSTFWQEPDRYTNTVLSLLQYAAKIHEALIYMSLTDIILLRIRYDMAGNLGVPFGLLTSGMQLSSLTFLSTANFISGAFASIQHCLRGDSPSLLEPDRRACVSHRCQCSLRATIAFFREQQHTELPV